MGCFVGKVSIDCCCGFAAFCDGPDDERLTAAHIAGSEDAVDRGHVVGVGGDVAALVESDAKLLDHAVLDGTEEAHGEKNEIDIERELGVRDGFELGRRTDADRREPV